MSATLTPSANQPPPPGTASSGIIVEGPRQGGRRSKSRATKTNFELYAWIFVRMSGLLLVFMVLAHLFIQMVTDGGVQKVNFAFVAGRWSNPFWQTFDLTMLWLSQLHGHIGMRTIINDYAERDQTRFWLKMLLNTATVLTLVLGSLVIFTFDPNI